MDTRAKPAHDGECIETLALSGSAGQKSRVKSGFVYIMANRPNGVIYVGVTSHLVERIRQHRTGAFDGFTKRYGLKTLVWYEAYDDIRTAIQREKNIKHWPRAWKVRLIGEDNPEWRDLWPEITA